MEEIISTDALVQEILEDARKKALRILKTADDTLEAQRRDWEAKTQKDVADIRASYAARTERREREIFARLPLDKRRLRSENAEGFLVKAMNDYLRSLNREELLSVLVEEFSRRLKISAAERAADQGTKPTVLYSGLSLSEAREALERALGEAKDWDFVKDSHVREFPSLVINAQTMKITASVENAAGVLLKEKRAELAAALLGEGVLND